MSARLHQFDGGFEETHLSPRATDLAMFGMALSFVELKYCTEGEAYLQDLTKRFPRSSLVEKANRKIKEIRKIKRNKKLCMT